MSDNWAGDLAEAIMEKTRSKKDDQNLLIGHVASVHPLSIKMYDQVVNKYVYADPAFTAFSDSQINEAFADIGDMPIPLANLLKQALTKPLIKSGDTVVVWQSGISFYILAKVG